MNHEEREKTPPSQIDSSRGSKSPTKEYKLSPIIYRKLSTLSPVCSAILHPDIELSTVWRMLAKRTEQSLQLLDYSNKLKSMHDYCQDKYNKVEEEKNDIAMAIQEWKDEVDRGPLPEQRILQMALNMTIEEIDEQIADWERLLTYQDYVYTYCARARITMLKWVRDLKATGELTKLVADSQIINSETKHDQNILKAKKVTMPSYDEYDKTIDDLKLFFKQ